MTDETDAYRGERRTGGQLVFDQDGNTLDKATDVVDIHSGGFDWGESADNGKLLQLAVALLNDRLGEDFAKKYHHGFAAYLDETLDGDEWELAPSEIGSQNYDRDTPFDNRCDAVGSPGSDSNRTDAASADNSTSGGQENEFTDDNGGDSEQSNATSSAQSDPDLQNETEQERCMVAAKAAVDDALEAVAEEKSKPGVPKIDFQQEEPPEEVVKELRVEIGKRAVSEELPRKQLKEAAFDRLNELFGGPASRRSVNRTKGPGAEFDWLSEEELATA
jgi:hypothetical protein